MGEADVEEAGRGEVDEAAVGAADADEGWGMGSQDETRTLHPDEAARELAISMPSLRRYAADYEGVFDELPRYEGRRVFDLVALERLRTAQALLRSGEVPSLKEALLMVKDEPGLVTLVGTAGVAEAEGEASALEDADLAEATREAGSSSTADAPDEADAPAQQVGPPLEARLEPGDAGAYEKTPEGDLQVTLHLTKSGWRLVAEGGAGEGERLLALLEPLVRAAGVTRDAGHRERNRREGEAL